MLDTNVIAEATKPRPSAAVRAWLDARDEGSLFISVITLGEIRQGIELKHADRKRAAQLEQALADVESRFAGRVLPIDTAVAERWGEISGRARRTGRGPLSAIDALIAATAIQHHLVVATRNERHFAHTGAAVLNPFDPGSATSI